LTENISLIVATYCVDHSSIQAEYLIHFMS